MKKTQTTTFQKLQLLKRSIKQLRQVTTSHKKSNLIFRIKRLFRQLDRWAGFTKLKPGIVASMIAVGFSFGPQTTVGQNFFGEPVESAFVVSAIESSYLQMPSFADLDNDGDFDMLVSGFANDYNTGQEYIYYENTGDASNPVFSDGELNLFGLGGQPFDAIIDGPGIFVDLDNDGDFDVLNTLISYAFTDVLVFNYQENIGTKEAPVFAESVPNPFNLNIDNKSIINFISSVDLDNDGDADIILNNYNYDANSSQILYFENIGSEVTPDFKEPIKLTDRAINFQSNGNVQLMSSSFADMDNDGDMDLLVGLFQSISESDNRFFTHYYENISDDEIAFKDPVENPFNLMESEDNFILPELVDIDADGDFDIFSYRYSTDGLEDAFSLFFYENTKNTPDNVGIEDFIEKLTFKVAPNPANDFVRITLEDGFIAEDTFVKIYDLKGKLLLQKPLNNNRIDVSGLVSGAYVLEINHKDVNHYKKILIE